MAKLLSDGTINIEGDADITIKSKANINLEATADVTIKGANITLESGNVFFGKKGAANEMLKGTSITAWLAGIAEWATSHTHPVAGVTPGPGAVVTSVAAPAYSHKGGAAATGSQAKSN